MLNPSTGEVLFTEDDTAYLQQGYRSPTADELEHAARVEEFGSFSQQSQAQLERVVRGATFGAVDGFGSEEENRARAEVSQELSPVISGAASIAPDLAIAALSGGLGGLATGAGRAAGRAALAEGSGLIRAGLATARAGGTAALGAESLGTGLVGASQSAYAEDRSFAEDPGKYSEDLLLWGGLNFGLGAFMLGAGRAGRQGGKAEAAALDDIAEAAEARAASATQAAPDGAPVPDAPSPLPEQSIPGTPGQIYDIEGAPGMRWEQTAPAESVDEFVARQEVSAGAVREGEREAVEAGVERALNNASKSEADDILDRAIGKAPEREADSFGRQRRLYINRDAIHEVAVREMQKDLSSLVEDVGKVARQDKLESVAKHVSDNLAAQRGVANGVAEDAARFAGEMRAEARAYAAASGKKGQQYAIPGAKGWSLALMDHAKKVQEATTGKALFEALDGFKRTAQDFKLSLETGALNSTNPIHHQQLIPRIDAFAQKLRGALEDEKTWGRAGEMQRAYNGIISDRLMPSLRMFEEAVMQKTHRGYDGIWKMEGWENKIGKLLKETDPGQRRHVFAVLDAMEELGSARRKFGDAAMADKIGAGVAKVRRTVGLADEVADATERMHALGQVIGGGPMGGFIAGGLAGGIPGAAIGAALPGAVRGFVMGDLINAFQRLSGATDQALARGVDDWIQSSRLRGTGVKLPKVPTLSDEAKQLRDVAARRGVSHGMALFMGEDESPGAAFERLRDALSDDQRFFEWLSDDYSTLQNEAPDTYMALAGQAQLARAYLLERMPPNVAVSMARPNGYPPNREAIEDWSLFVNAVRHPQRLLKNIGGLRVQEVETLRTLYPRAWEKAQLQLLTGIQRANEAGEQLDDNFLARVGMLFPDIDGAGSPVFSNEFGTVVRDYMWLQRQKQGGGGPSPKQIKRGNPATAPLEMGATYGTA